MSWFGQTTRIVKGNQARLTRRTRKLGTFESLESRRLLAADFSFADTVVSEDVSVSESVAAAQDVASASMVDQLEGELLFGNTFLREIPIGDFDADVVSAVIDYGNGTVHQVTIAETTTTLYLAHNYVESGIYQVAITVYDDDGESTTSDFEVEVLEEITLNIANADGTVEGGELAFSLELSKPIDVDTYVVLHIGGSADRAFQADDIHKGIRIVRIPAGSTTAQLIVETYDDDNVEPAEIVTVEIESVLSDVLHSARFVSAENSIATGLVIDDDMSIHISESLIYTASGVPVSHDGSWVSDSQPSMVANVGSVSVNSDGTWDWNSGADGISTNQTVMITAIDSHDQSEVTQFDIVAQLPNQSFNEAGDAILTATDGNDRVEVYLGSESNLIRIAGRDFIFPVETQVHVGAGNGVDSLSVLGTATEDTFEVGAKGRNAHFNGMVHIYGFHSITVDGNGGNDWAEVYGAMESDDNYVWTADKAIMTGPNFVYEIHDVGTTRAFGRGGKDVAMIYDTDRDDVVYAWQSHWLSALTTYDGRISRNLDFDVEYRLSGGTDRAVLSQMETGELMILNNSNVAVPNRGLLITAVDELQAEPALGHRILPGI